MCTTWMQEHFQACMSTAPCEQAKAMHADVSNMANKATWMGYWAGCRRYVELGPVGLCMRPARQAFVEVLTTRFHCSVARAWLC